MLKKIKNPPPQLRRCWRGIFDYHCFLRRLYKLTKWHLRAILFLFFLYFKQTETMKKPKNHLRHLLEKYLPKTYAIKFNIKDETAGVYVMLLNTQINCVGIGKGIFLVGETVLQTLDETGIAYRKFRVKPGEVSSIFKEAERRGWFNPEKRLTK